MTGRRRARRPLVRRPLVGRTAALGGPRASAPLALLALLAGSCEQTPAPAPPPRFLAVDLLDAQDLQGGQPARRRLYDGQAVQAAPDSGPDLSLRAYLSAPLSSQSVSDAQTFGLLLRDNDGEAVALRSVTVEDPEAQVAPGAAQALVILPDLRSARSYVLSFDRGYLSTADMSRFEVPPALPFRSAARFAVLRADPPGGARARQISQLRLSFSSPVNARPSGVYGVVLTSGGKELEASYKLSGNARQLTVTPTCPLPLGDTRISVPVGAVEEDDTLSRLAEPFEATVTVTEDPGPCAEAPDMAQDMGRGDL